MNMQYPVMTRELARRIQRVINALQVGGKRYLQQQPGNPYGIEIEQFGNATAYLAQAVKTVGWWNRVIGLEQEDAALIDDILAFFRAHRLQCNIDMDPTVFTADFARLLQTRLPHSFDPAQDRRCSESRLRPCDRTHRFVRIKKPEQHGASRAAHRVYDDHMGGWHLINQG